MINNRVCVFCASSSDVDPFYLDEAERLGKELAESGREIIYGGGNIGLMGRLADGSLKNGGYVIGVIPTFLDSLELGHTGCQELIQVEDMHTREKRMITDSDCIVTLPGGCGTFEELLQAVTWKRLGLIISPIIIDRIQDSEGNTIINNDKRSCANCDKISFTGVEYPEIKDNYKQVFSSQTAYQITSLLEGAIKRGTGKKLKDLNLNIAGKTGTTNENTDAWFIGFTSDLVIGVYVGMDNPQPLGKFETGSKTALPIFKDFIQSAVKKSEARPFKVSEGITMMVVDPSTGQKAKFSSKNTILEAYKSKNVVNGEILYSNNNRLDSNNILKFY